MISDDTQASLAWACRFSFSAVSLGVCSPVEAGSGVDECGDVDLLVEGNPAVSRLMMVRLLRFVDCGQKIPSECGLLAEARRDQKLPLARR